MGLNETVADYIRGDERRCDFDSAGEAADWGDRHGAGAVVVLVTPVTDALKRTLLGRVQSSVDREELWEVVGVSVDRVIVETKPDDITTVGAWLEYLRDNDVGIEVTVQSGDPAMPNT